MSADGSLLFCLGEHIHHALETLGPIALGDAVHEADIEIVGAEFAAEAVEIGAGCSSIARPGLGQHGNFVARHVFERLGHVRMASVGISCIEEAQPVIVAVEEQIR